MEQQDQQQATSSTPNTKHHQVLGSVITLLLAKNASAGKSLGRADGLDGLDSSSSEEVASGSHPYTSKQAENVAHAPGPQTLKEASPAYCRGA